MDSPDMMSIDERLSILHRTHEAVLKIWTEDGTKETRLRRFRMQASSETVFEIIQWLYNYRLCISTNELQVYLELIAFLEKSYDEVMWQSIDHDHPESVAAFQGKLRAYELALERVFM